jgi:hypothetical protein
MKGLVWRTKAQSGFWPLVIKKKEVVNLTPRRRIRRSPLTRWNTHTNIRYVPFWRIYYIKVKNDCQEKWHRLLVLGQNTISYKKKKFFTVYGREPIDKTSNIENRRKR